MQCDKPGSSQTRKVSPMMYYQPFLFKHKDCFPLILLSGRQFHQLLVDMCVKIEAERRSYLNHNQDKLRRENYTTLREAAEDAGGIHDEAEQV